MTASRESSLAQWFSRQQMAGGQGVQLEPVSGDASFRRYFRARRGAQSWVLMDAPPEKESCEAFVRIAERFTQAGIRAPRLHAQDHEQGFLCLDDFGSTLLWEPLERARLADNYAAAGALYRRAFTELVKIQALPVDAALALPPYDQALLDREMELFREWFCARLLGLALSPQDQLILDRAFLFLREAALAQPRVCVHRDYHSRNLMLLEDAGIGVLDFQDAVLGPLSYDPVSLLKDCYIAWPREQVRDWLNDYRDAARAAGLPVPAEAAFLRDFDLMGAQRHLKAIGIFARLKIRDGKPGYLPHIPRTLGYLRDVARAQEELQDFSAWLERRLLPAAAAVLEGPLPHGAET